MPSFLETREDNTLVPMCATSPGRQARWHILATRTLQHPNSRTQCQRMTVARAGRLHCLPLGKGTFCGLQPLPSSSAGEEVLGLPACPSTQEGKQLTPVHPFGLLTCWGNWQARELPCHHLAMGGCHPSPPQSTPSVAGDSRTEHHRC